MARTHDVVVLGATPAGFAAAYYLARQKLDVSVMDAPAPCVECPLSDWSPKGLIGVAGLPPGLGKRSGAAAFSRVCYHSVQLNQQVEHRSRGTLGHFVRAGQLVQALRSACRAAGVRTYAGATSPAIRLEEDHVELIGSNHLTGRLLIVAQSRPNDVLGELAMPLRTVPNATLVAAGVDVPLRARSARSLAGALHVVELPERSELGAFFAVRDMLHLRVISNSPASGTRVAELSSMVARLQQARLIPADLALGRATGAVWRPPAGVALELETHVAKRCLLAGTAGGFAESITGQALAPSVRSALLAAKVAAEALKARDVQGELMKFKTVWRRSLADSLRPPNTSLHMLLPLLFVNERIVAKFTRALLYGENI